jgi:putative hydrolases of HD superfamily
MIHSLVNLIFESLHLKHVKHEGWRLIGVEHPDSVAEHSLCAAQIAYILAKMEWANPEKCATMLIWHDMPETRIGDLHRNASKYLTDKQQAEESALHDQVSELDFWAEIEWLFHEYEYGTTKEGIIAKDADYLEQAFQARKYGQSGYSGTERWIQNVWKRLQTESAKKLFEEMQQSDFWEWSRVD